MNYESGHAGLSEGRPQSAPKVPGLKWHDTDDDDLDLDLDLDLYSDEELRPPAGKRLAPVGQAANEEDEQPSKMKSEGGAMTLDSGAMFAALGGGGMGGGCGSGDADELQRRIEEMEEEQEELNSSLMSMTSHFAKVSLFQLRFLICFYEGTNKGNIQNSWGFV